MRRGARESSPQFHRPGTLSNLLPLISLISGHRIRTFSTYLRVLHDTFLTSGCAVVVANPRISQTHFYAAQGVTRCFAHADTGILFFSVAARPQGSWYTAIIESMEATSISNPASRSADLHEAFVRQLLRTFSQQNEAHPVLRVTPNIAKWLHYRTAAEDSTNKTLRRSHSIIQCEPILRRGCEALSTDPTCARGVTEVT